MKDDLLTEGLGCLGVVALALLLAVVLPLAYAAGGYFTGWILANLFSFAGDWVVGGAASLNIEITRDSLPLIGALLGFVGAFFRSTQTNNNNKK